ncbi:sulfatase [Flammeovirga sp. EKP202]|uniref:sulfatase n=1 Tax=Flammeovirga sp. EKP202 TaxID=2770592 RepID=UPI001CB7C496|nr:sulfatase [Flammeovirga sp. EKP202]
MNKMLKLALLLFTFNTAVFPLEAKEKKKKPNIVFILVDDLGWSDVGFNGSTFYETPNLDQFAKEGMQFKDAYTASPVCSPTRASIMTGKYPHRINFWRATPTHNLPQEDITIAEALKEGGYRTAHMGKWHLMLKNEKGKNSTPLDHGFDINIAGHGAGQPASYFFPYKSEKRKKDNVPNMEDGKEGDYLTDALTSKAIRFMEEAEDEPFFLNLWFYTVHTPVQSKPEKTKKYQKKYTRLGLGESKGTTPEVGERNHRKQQDNPKYAGMVESMDENVGRLLDYLKKSGKDKNTIVIFMSDNGGLSTIKSSKGGPTCNLPLRAGKAWTYEGGIRVPMVIRWPGVTKAGTVSQEAVISTDFYPTILDMAGLPLKPNQHLDGLSLKPLLSGKKTELDREAIYFHYTQNHHVSGQGPSGAIRSGDFKLIERFSDKGVELYNLKEDIGEQNDLSKSNPKKVAYMTEQLHKWRKETGAEVPKM